MPVAFQIALFLACLAVVRRFIGNSFLRLTWSLRKEQITDKIVLIIFAQQSLYAGEKFDPTLIPSIFAPESVPAHSISHLAGFVLAIAGVIFVVVGGLLVYAVVRFRRRADDD